MTDNFLVKSSYNLENTTGTSSNLRFLLSCHVPLQIELDFVNAHGQHLPSQWVIALAKGFLGDRSLAKVKTITIHDQR